MILKRKIGIYGGTFNPPHIGHIKAAEAFVAAIGLDELIIMPDFLPPHKTLDEKIDASDRLEMCKLAFSHIKKANVSDFEIKRGGKSYTAVTLQEHFSDDWELYFLCGTDMFLTLDTWYSAVKIFKLAKICYVRRENDADTERQIVLKTKKYREVYHAEIIPIFADVNEISSTELRESLKNGDSARFFLSAPVYNYIRQKGIYK